MRDKPMRQQSGASLIEILVTILILSFGMLALSGMMAYAVQMPKFSAYRATAVALARQYGAGPFRFRTPAGPIVIDTTEVDGRIRAGFTSVEPWVVSMPAGTLVELTGLLGLTAQDVADIVAYMRSGN